MKWRLLVGFTLGLVLMIVSAESYKEDVLYASVAGTFAIYTFLLVGFEIREQKEKSQYCKSVKFKDLKPGIYGVRMNPFPVKDLFPFSSYASYFMLIEFCARSIIVEFPDDRSKGSLQVAMRKFIEDITDEDGFTVHKDGSVTNNRI